MLLLGHYMARSQGFALFSITSKVYFELICWTACDRAADIKYGFCCQLICLAYASGSLISPDWGIASAQGCNAVDSGLGVRGLQ